MALIPLIDCYDLLDMDAKTLRTALKRAGITPVPHPTDARIKCLTTAQIERLAAVHARLLRPNVDEPGASVPVSAPSAPSGDCSPPTRSEDSCLAQQLARLETRVIQLSDQLTSLALILLKLRDRNLEERLQTLEADLAHLAAPPLSSSSPPSQGRVRETNEAAIARKPARPLIPAEEQARSRMPPLIEYSAQGSYVIVSSQEGELPLRPDSREWFDWLASLTSFRFVGQAGRFTAYRDRDHGKPTRGWIAHRCIHNRHFKHYLAVTDQLTIARLEQMAAWLQAQVSAL